MSSEVRVERRDGYVEVRLDRPAKRNALTGDMYRTMTETLMAASREADVAAVLFSGEGGGFCAGNDLEDFLKGPEGGAPAFAFIRALAAFDKPLVAAVQGQAIGIGTTLLFHCDLVYAAPDARFAMPFVDLGLVPEAGASLLAPQRLGMGRAAAMLLLGEPIDAAAAERAGLVTAIVGAETLRAHAQDKTRALAAKPRQALAMTRRLMRAPSITLADQIEAEAELFDQALQSDEARAAFTAFLARRAPRAG